MDNLIGWRCKKKYRMKTESQKDRLRSQFSVLVAGQDVPCPIKSFRSMRLPKELRNSLKLVGIQRPTGLQIQGLPVVLSGRDSLLLSISREGKTCIFVLPIIIACIQEELKLKFISGEGPLALIIVPSRELAQQIYDFIQTLVSSFRTYPNLNLVLCTGGMDLQGQVQAISQGVHIIISTPGRLSDMFSKDIISLKMCKFLVIDEADRLLDLGFDEEVKSVMNKSSFNLQVILSSPTLPKRMQDFATNFLKNPIYVSADRNGLQKLKIVQYSHWTPEGQKLIKLLEALLKTEPPVLVFCENKAESDKLEEYLNNKKIKCASLHGGKAQTLRSKAIRDFNRKKVDVLLATDMAAKGLSFKDIQHIVNYDLPKDLESYIQRVCRSNTKAVVSNFVDTKADKAFLKELTGFLAAMGDRTPSFLSEYSSLLEETCEICKNPGHSKLFCSIFQQDSLKYELPLVKNVIK